jgi:solute carrier family 25 citrate transporter 1
VRRCYTMALEATAVVRRYAPAEWLTLSCKTRAGFGAGVTEALVIVTPFEVVKIKLQQQKGLALENLKYKGTLHCATTILKEQGPMGLWAGATPTVCRNGTNQMCLFAMKANCDKWLWGKHEGDGMQLLWWQVRAPSIPR